MTKLIKVKNDDLTEVTQPVPTAVEFEEIASGSVELPTGTNKSMFLDSLDGEYKNIDSLGVVSPFGSGGGGGLQPVFIDHTSIPAELVRNRIYEADFSGAPVDSTLVVTFPEGTGSETFILGFRVTGLSQGSTVTFVTTNTQDIFFPDATTDTTITGVNAKTYFEFAWDQTRFVYGDVDSPTFADLSASLGNVEVDTLTVDSIVLNTEITDGVAAVGTVIEAGYAGQISNNLDDTYIDVSNDLILTEGVWVVSFDFSFFCNTAVASNTRIFNKTDSVALSNSVRFFTATVDGTKVVSTTSFFSIPKGQTKTLSVQSRANTGTTDPLISWGNSITGTLTNPDNEHNFSAVKLAVAPA
jgi:hypothetical protein